MEQTADTKPCAATVTCRRTSVIEIEAETLPLDTAMWVDDKFIESVDVEHTDYGTIVEKSFLQKLCDRDPNLIIKYILKTYPDVDYYYFKLKDL